MTAELPLVSIVIPTHQRADQLAACLSSLLRLDYPRDRFEVIVVDDGSATPLDAVVEPFVGPLTVTLVRQENTGPASARNSGAARARGRYLAFTDDDCCPAADWLRVLVARIDHRTCAVGGQTLNALSGDPYATASQLLMNYLYSYYNHDHEHAHFLASNNFLISANEFCKLGGFHAGYTRAAAEDRDLCDRWLAAGYSLRYVPQAVVWHAHKMTLGRFWLQHFNYGRGAWAFHRARARRGQGKIEVEPMSFYFKLLLFPYRHHSGFWGIWLMILLSVTQIANALGFLWQRWYRQ